jgi:hypothetical protein
LTALVLGIGDACAGLSSTDCHRIRLEWMAPNVGTVTQYHVYRVEGSVVSSVSTTTEIGAIAPAPGQAGYSLVDAQELSTGTYTYFATADFTGGARSGPSGFARVTAANDPPVAAGDRYTTETAVPLITAAPGVLANDTDTDSRSLTAALVTGPSHGILILNADGSFRYEPGSGFAGTDSFTYLARDADSSRASNVATVSITVTASGASFVGLQNAPPPAGKTFKAGSAVPMKWQYTRASAVVNSAFVNYTVTVRGPLPDGPVRIVTNTDPGSSSFRYDSATKTWQFNLQTKEQDGTSYRPGTYDVQVTPLAPGFLPSGIFQIKLAK